MKNRFTCALLAMILFLPWVSHAGIRISPINITMEPGERSATVRVTNEDKAREKKVQISAYKWSQTLNEHMLLGDTRNIAIFPPITTLAPGETQIVRVMLRKPTPGSYRLRFAELPDKNAQKVQTLLSITMPLFVESKSWQPVMSYVATRTGRGISLRATNTGKAYDRIQAVVIGDKRRGMNSYILSESVQNIFIPDNSSYNRSMLIVTDHGEQRVQIN